MARLGRQEDAGRQQGELLVSPVSLGQVGFLVCHSVWFHSSEGTPHSFVFFAVFLSLQVEFGAG